MTDSDTRTLSPLELTPARLPTTTSCASQRASPTNAWRRSRRPSTATVSSRPRSGTSCSRSDSPASRSHPSTAGAGAPIFAATGNGQLSAILVDTDQPGWQPGEPFDFLAFGGGATAPVFLDNVRAPEGHLVGNEGQGFDIMLRVEAAGKIRAAATSVGIAQRAQELAVDYALERRHRGQPIGQKFQTVQWLLGEIGANVEAARALTREAARRHDQGDDIVRLAASARIVAARTARTVTSDALQVFGSYGMVRGSEIERLYREGKFFEVGQGVIELQRLIVARSLMAERP